ncbi:hypothetical protein [Streptomyces sp. IBSBF 3136]|uniref:hypothetical protein n=1 Tax=Streptomyces sp. IBSBF 3136 TaxID=2903524 RepID=UPI002FDBBDDD
MAGSLVFATARPARAWRAVARRPDPLGVLRPPAMRLLLCALVFLGGMVGALDVAVTTLAPPGTSTEAVGWMSSAILGVAGGTALAGPLGGHFILPLLAAALCALLLSALTTPAAAPAAV